jgi:hypothetical protein
MHMRSQLCWLLFGFFVFGCTTQREKVELSITAHNDSSIRVLPYEANRYLFDKKNDYPYNSYRVDCLLVIQNKTKYNLHVYDEWCSWGYYSIEIELKFKNGETRTLKKRPGQWTINFPAMQTIPSNTSLAYPISLDESIWENIPELTIDQKIKLAEDMNNFEDRTWDDVAALIPGKEILIRAKFSPIYIEYPPSVPVSFEQNCETPWTSLVFRGHRGVHYQRTPEKWGIEDIDTPFRKTTGEH